MDLICIFSGFLTRLKNICFSISDLFVERAEEPRLKNDIVNCEWNRSLKQFSDSGRKKGIPQFGINCKKIRQFKA